MEALNSNSVTKMSNFTELKKVIIHVEYLHRSPGVTDWKHRVKLMMGIIFH